MIDITNQAISEIKKRFAKAQGTVSVRIVSAPSSCNTPLLMLKEDKRAPDDEVVSAEGLTLLLSRELDASVGGVRIRYDASHWGGGHLSLSPLVNLVAGSCGDCRC